MNTIRRNRIVLEHGAALHERQVLVYVGQHPEYRKYIGGGWITFRHGVPTPVPVMWAKALLQLGDKRGPMFKPLDASTVPTGCVTYAIKRNMGLGDVILVTPILKRMHEAWPWANLRYYVESRYMPVLRHNPYFTVCNLDEGVSPEDNAMIFDLIGVSERDSARMFHERIDVYARHVGVSLKDRMPRVYTNDAEKRDGAEHLREFGWKGGPLLGVQLISSRPERDYDCDRAAAVIRYWHDAEGYEVALFHNTQIDWDWGCPVVDMTGHTGDLGRLMNAVSNCNLFLGVDSGITHLAAAHGIPTVALAGAIKGALRYDCYPRCRIVERTDLKCVAAPHECYGCHKGEGNCMLHEPETVIAALGEVLCQT